MTAPTVFISYSHADEEWKDRLVAQLRVLQMEDVLDPWDDRLIEVGQDWNPEIEQAMNTASVAILLVSTDFLTSEFILNDEVPLLLERREKEGLRVFPVIIRPCPWKQVIWLARMHVRPKDGRPISGGDEYRIDTDMAAIAEEVAGIIQRAELTATSEGARPLGPDRISTARLPSTSPLLFGRERELAALDAAWANPQTNVVSLVAWGGVGKTALVNAWLNRMGRDGYRGAQRVYGWSFYSQGAAEGRQASGDLFIATALRWFGDPNPDEGSPWDKGERLAERVAEQRTLLILDGLEPLQYPPGEQEGRLKDPGLQSLLRGLARYNPGLCVISTRLPLTDLQEFAGASAEHLDLDDLSTDAGAKLLGSLGVEGTPDELRKAVCDFEGHALALTLLGRYLATVYGGDVRQRDKIARLTRERTQGAHARRVMESYEAWFGNKPELDVLRVMGLFDRPVDQGALQALRSGPPIKGLTSALAGLSDEKWRYALADLRNARLLADEDPTHPKPWTATRWSGCTSARGS